MDIPVLIILAVVCVGIGFLLDNLLRSLRRGNQREAMSGKGIRSPVHEFTGEAAGSEISASFPAQPGQSMDQELEEVLRIWRSPSDQELIVEVGGKKAHSPSGLDRGQLDRLGFTLQQLSSWLGQGVSSMTPGAAAALPQGWVEAGLENELETGQAAQGVQEGVKPLRLNPVELVANALRADVRKPSGPEVKSLAAQVDEVLQEKLKGTGFEKRGIRLTEGPDQGLLVVVGIEKYSGVNEVPDAQIRELIHEAVADWGKRTSQAR